MRVAFNIRTEDPFIEGGEVWHRRECRECQGAGTFVVCRWHPGTLCPCAGREDSCDACDGAGELVDAECPCSLCALTAESLADESKVECIRERADDAMARWKAGGH